MSTFYQQMGRALRAFDVLPGVVVEPVTYMGHPHYRVTFTDEARAVVSEMMGVRPPDIEVALAARVQVGQPLFTHRVTALTPAKEGNP